MLAPAGVKNNQIGINWSGYVNQAPQHAFTSVTGSWVVPPAGTVPPGVSSTWAGIGGFGTSDLIQAGTQQITPPVGSFFAGGSYAAWYELLPAGPVFLTNCSGDNSCAVQPGDAMTTTITNVGGDQWSISVGGPRWTFNRTVTYTSGEGSAEWIHESPSLAGAVPVPVGGSGAVTFDGNNTFALDGSSARQVIGAGSTTALDLLPVEATASALDSEGDGFNVCTYAVSCAPPSS